MVALKTTLRTTAVVNLEFQTSFEIRAIQYTSFFVIRAIFQARFFLEIRAELDCVRALIVTNKIYIFEI